MGLGLTTQSSEGAFHEAAAPPLVGVAFSQAQASPPTLDAGPKHFALLPRLQTPGTQAASPGSLRHWTTESRDSGLQGVVPTPFRALWAPPPTSNRKSRLEPGSGYRPQGQGVAELKACWPWGVEGGSDEDTWVSGGASV